MIANDKRFPNDSSEATGLKALGWRRARPTPTKKLPVNKWSLPLGEGQRLVLRQNNASEFFVERVESQVTGRPWIMKYSYTHANPLALISAAVLEGDGNVEIGLLRLHRPH